MAVFFVRFRIVSRVLIVFGPAVSLKSVLKQSGRIEVLTAVYLSAEPRVSAAA